TDVPLSTSRPSWRLSTARRPSSDGTSRTTAKSSAPRLASWRGSCGTLRTGPGRRCRVAKTNTPIPYYGAKDNLAPWIVSHLPSPVRRDVGRAHGYDTVRLGGNNVPRGRGRELLAGTSRPARRQRRLAPADAIRAGRVPRVPRRRREE